MGITSQSGYQSHLALPQVHYDWGHKLGHFHIGCAAHRHLPQQRRSRQCSGTRDVCRYKPDLIAGFKLPQLPQVGLDHCDRTDETTQAWAVRAQNHRHVARKIHGPDRIRIVMDVGGMQPSLPSVGAHPLGFWPDQPNTGAARIEMHFPLCGEECLDIGRCEILGRPMGAVNHTDLSARPQRLLLWQLPACT
ncbi:hypothetical protein D3C80_1383410 [compost metagenome]